MPVRVHEDSPVYFGELGRMLSESIRNDPVIQLKLADKRRQLEKQLSDDQELAKELQEEEEHQAVLAAARAPLSSSPDPGPPPITASSASPGPSPSAAFIFSGLPVTRVASSNQPTYTTQMNEMWMRKHEDKTKETRRVGGNRQIDLEMVQKFRIIWWEVVCSIPNVLLSLFHQSLGRQRASHIYGPRLPSLAKMEDRRLPIYAQTIGTYNTSSIL
jgi:hypothetical protein